MQINTNLNCRKPIKFTGVRDTGKVRYKHYEQMSDQALSAYSMIKAYKDVKESSKSKLLKAMPIIGSTLIATSLAFTQPGKLSGKVSTGVGFLALINLANFISNKVSKIAFNKLNKKEDKNSDTISKINKANIIGWFGAMAGVVGAGLAVSKGKDVVLKSGDKFSKIIKSEGQKLSEEINSSKFAKVIEEKFNPFMTKHQKGFSRASYILPIGIILGNGVAQGVIKNSLSDDFSKLTVKNFIKGKAAQKDAREHFDSIDAIEV